MRTLEEMKSSFGNGCHVCGEHHGTAHYFNICTPKYRYLEEMAARADEMRPTPTLSPTTLGKDRV